MVLKIKLVFENYATFYLSALYIKRKKKQTKSKVYICCQLNMKSSSFWDTYLLWQNIINYWIPDEKQWLDESKCKFLFGVILLPVKAGTINDVIFTTGMPTPLDNKRFYTAVTLFLQDIENLKIDMNYRPKIILAQSTRAQLAQKNLSDANLLELLGGCVQQESWNACSRYGAGRRLSQ